MKLPVRKLFKFHSFWLELWRWMKTPAQLNISVDSWHTAQFAFFLIQSGNGSTFHVSFPFSCLWTNRLYQLHTGTGCLMHIKHALKDRSFDENLENKYSSHWHTICELSSTSMKPQNYLRRINEQFHTAPTLLPLVSHLVLLCMIENCTKKNTFYYWPSSF